MNPSYARDPASKKRPLVTVKDLQWLIYLYPARFFAATLPVGMLHWLGGLAKPLFRMTRRKEMQTMADRLVLATGKESSSPDVRKAARAFLDNAVVRGIDDLVLDRLLKSGKLRCADLRGEEHLKKALDRGRGVMVVTGHFYGGRVGKRYLATIGYPLLSVRFGRRVDRLMGRFGQKLFWARYSRFLHDVIGDEVLITDPEVSLKILKRLRSDGLVNIHVDVGLDHSRTRLPFLGRRKRFAEGALEIAHVSGCQVIPMLCLGDSRHFTITFGEPFELVPSESRTEFVDVNMPTLVRNLEAQILAYPDQWEQWEHL